jgi:GT2 family glycosyltransferase
VNSDPRIGVVVLTYNRPRELDQTLGHLRELPERPAIVVVDNGSTGEAQALISERFPGVRHLKLGRNLGAAARNIGVEACPHPYVALCDDDTWWAPGSIATAADLFDRHPTLAIVTAKVLVGSEHRIDPTSEMMARSPIPAPAGVPGCPLLGFLAGASAVRRSAFLEAGGFEPRMFIGGEEDLLAYDLACLGWRLSYVEELIVHHHPSAARDARTRQQLLARNRLWTAWMRRPIRRALAQTLQTGFEARTNPLLRGALIAALRGLPWVIRRRKRLPLHIEKQILLLEKGGR